MTVYLGEQEIDLESDCEATFCGDRWLIRTPEGVFSGAKVFNRGKLLVSFKGRTFEFELSPPVQARASSSGGNLNAIMPGVVIEVFVKVGDPVIEGQKLGLLEAMKTQQPILSPIGGVVKNVKVAPGEQVSQDQVLFEISPRVED